MIYYKGRHLATDYFQGSAFNKTRRADGKTINEPRDPVAADVLACLLADIQGGDLSFENWCGEYGFDVDSRKSYTVWTQCLAMAPKVRALLGSEFEIFQSAEH